MKLKFFKTIIIAFFFNQMNAQSIARVENIKIHSKTLNQEREILIYTPVDYDWRVNECFNVIYVFDSQNREFFDYTNSIVSFLPNNGKSFIVVGITSPFIEEIDYGRNNDFLPVLATDESIKRYGKYSGNAGNFVNYVESEVIPYINSNYRTLNQNIAVGHSLGASFILYSLIKKPNLFQNYIAISPNLAYDDDKLSKELIYLDYTKINNQTFIYISNADEGIEYWKEWKPARDRVYSFFKDSLKNKNITVEIAEFPNNNHLNTFPPSLNNALQFYFKNIQKNQDSELSKEKFEVTIRVKVSEKGDIVYITGNQPNLGDWNPNKNEMKKISELEREIVLKIQSPAQFKFTKGSWETELQVVGTYNNVIIKPEMKKEFEFEIAVDK
ncbi:alpha/beta hydrolase-fold protein [Chryseobacterium sp. MDT2-18]|uniref:alpha/beta hydrolase-fold protein n=1 Tax=Chryseobacterium sp. MDT2-18 TaxID=1259136 RepID=UPI0027821BD8|nr:alpha/beta hydrolase-fold protein [Chryseobacterium sp. MDT2-18]MDQ0477094.1 putative alpha/beta superfamily hydrolase [Chryseobacterium sp. MDT2-18]